MDLTSFSDVLRRHPDFLRPSIPTEPPAVRWPIFPLLAMGLDLPHVLQSRSTWRQTAGFPELLALWLSRLLFLSLQREGRRKAQFLEGCTIVKALKGWFVGPGMVNHWGWFQKLMLEVCFTCVSIYEQHCNLFRVKCSGKENGVRYLWYLDKNKLLSWKLWNWGVTEHSLWRVTELKK